MDTTTFGAVVILLIFMIPGLVLACAIVPATHRFFTLLETIRGRVLWTVLFGVSWLGNMWNAYMFFAMLSVTLKNARFVEPSELIDKCVVCGLILTCMILWVIVWWFPSKPEVKTFEATAQSEESGPTDSSS